METEITKVLTLTEDEWEFLKRAIDGYIYVASDYLGYDETRRLQQMGDRIYRQMPEEVF